jgi:glycosyltransferase involved in cell wall biosynthesis
MVRIGFLLPAHYCFSPTNGIRQEAMFKQAGLRGLGHQVDLLTPWTVPALGSLDIVHFFYGGLPLAHVTTARVIRPARLIFSTTIDSNRSMLTYRVASYLGALFGSLHTVQGEFRRQAQAADRIVVRSQHERQRVVHGLGIPERKVHVVHLGVDLAQVDRQRAAAQNRAGIFHLSTFAQPRKNILRLIAAVGPTGLPLTIAGFCPEADLPAIRAAARPYPQIRILGVLTPEERDDLYYGSRVYALPSLHEGTGLSALEAAARGCAVVITKNGGPPDYFGEIGHLVDPHSVSSIRAGILAAHAQSSPTQIAEHVARRFHQQACAERLAAVYQD